MSRNSSPPPPPLPQSAPPTALRNPKQKSFGVGIAAGAEDVKYQGKYKELKRKVKDIEADNDKLHIKVMNAKLTIQRMKMERAILYERLAVAPNSPPMQDRVALPVVHPSSGVPSHPSVPNAHHRRDIRGHSASVEPDQGFPPYPEYNNLTRGTPALLSGMDGRPLSTVDTAPPPGVAPSPHMSIVQSPRRVSGDHDARQRLPIARHMTGSLLPHDGHPSRSHSTSHTSPAMEHEFPPVSYHTPHLHHRTRSQSGSHSHSHQTHNSSFREGHYPESLQPQAFSPPLSERERSRQSDMRSLPPGPGDLHGHGHHQPPLAQLSPQESPAEVRRMHPHQRIGPGTYINRDEFQERARDLDRDREREWEHERSSRDLARNRELPSMHSPHSVHRPRQPIERGGDYPDHHMSSREEQPHFYDGPPSRAYPLVSRSGTPGSASASGSGAGLGDESSRPDSRTQYHEHEQARSSYRLRPVPQPKADNDEIDFVHEDGRSHARGDRVGHPPNSGGGGSFALPEQNPPPTESRKRSRNDMEVDSENDVGDSGRWPGLYYNGRLEDRGSKRYRERQHRRSIDLREEGGVGPS